MSNTSVESFYEKTMDDLTRAINAYVKSSECEIKSVQVFQNPKNAWFEAIVLFEKPIIYEVEVPNIINGPPISVLSGKGKR